MDKVVGGVGMQLVTEMEIVPYYDLVICGVMSYNIFSQYEEGSSEFVFVWSLHSAYNSQLSSMRWTSHNPVNLCTHCCTQN